MVDWFWEESIENYFTLWNLSRFLLFCFSPRGVSQGKTSFDKSITWLCCLIKWLEFSPAFSIFPWRLWSFALRNLLIVRVMNYWFWGPTCEFPSKNYRVKRKIYGKFTKIRLRRWAQFRNPNARSDRIFKFYLNLRKELVNLTIVI